jgi:hypothetical protein
MHVRFAVGIAANRMEMAPSGAFVGREAGDCLANRTVLP